jgi:DNA repair protein RadC
MSKIKDIPKVDRPRERMIKYGPDKLMDEELLALVLGSGIKGVNVKTLAKRILKKYKNTLETVTVKEFAKEKGLGEAKASQVVAVLELGKRVFAGKKAKLVLSPKDVWERCEDFRGSKREHFAVFFLDSRNQAIKKEIISIGTLNASLVHPREVFESAIKTNTASIILVHNHPSGDTGPSNEDIKLTKRIAEAGKLLGIEVLDHIIITTDGHLSMKEEGYFISNN